MNNILLKNCIEIDSGATGTVYAYGCDMAVKIFSQDYPLWKIEREYRNARLFNEADLPAPKCCEIISTNRGYGIVFERVQGTSLTKAISECPARLDEYVGKMVALMRKIHEVEVNTASVISAKSKYLEHLTECRAYYDGRDIERLKELVLAIPEREKLLHGDFHTGNIMVDGDENLMVIDFAEVCFGHPIFDIMAEGAIIPVTLENDPKLAESYLGISAALMQEIWESYMRFYLPDANNLEELRAEARMISRLRNAITAAITDGIPEAYLINCADNTRSVLMPEIPRLLQVNWSKWE